jgi:hypothetical protein
MYALIRHALLHKLLPQQILSGGMAFLIANQFYKFHSFGLECIAFLGTWCLFDYVSQSVMKLLAGKKE